MKIHQNLHFENLTQKQYFLYLQVRESKIRLFKVHQLLKVDNIQQTIVMFHRSSATPVSNKKKYLCPIVSKKLINTAFKNTRATEIKLSENYRAQGHKTLTGSTLFMRKCVE